MRRVVIAVRPAIDPKPAAMAMRECRKAIVCWVVGVLVERRYAPVLNGRYSRSLAPPSVTLRMTKSS
jgi:hypothetical protein